MPKAATKTVSPPQQDLLLVAEPARRKGRGQALQPAAPPPPAPVAAKTETDKFIELAKAIALDPDARPESLKMILDAQERVFDRQARMAFDAALEQMIPEIPPIKKMGKIDQGETRSKAQGVKAKFARRQDIHKVITPILKKYGFALRFTTDVDETNRLCMTGVLSGHGWREQSTYRFPAEASGGKNLIQGFGSSTEYAMRYLMVSMLSISTDGDTDGIVQHAEDDGPDREETVDKDQIQRLSAKMDMVGMKPDRFFEHYQIERLDDLPKRVFSEAMQRLTEFGNAKKTRTSDASD